MKRRVLRNNNPSKSNQQPERPQIAIRVRIQSGKYAAEILREHAKITSKFSIADARKNLKGEDLREKFDEYMSEVKIVETTVKNAIQSGMIKISNGLKISSDRSPTVYQVISHEVRAFFDLGYMGLDILVVEM